MIRITQKRIVGIVKRYRRRGNCVGTRGEGWGFMTSRSQTERFAPPLIGGQVQGRMLMSFEPAKRGRKWSGMTQIEALMGEGKEDVKRVSLSELTRAVRCSAHIVSVAMGSDGSNEA